MVVEVPIMDVEVTVGQASNTAVALLLLGDTPGGGANTSAAEPVRFFTDPVFFASSGSSSNLKKDFNFVNTFLTTTHHPQRKKFI